MIVVLLSPESGEPALRKSHQSRARTTTMTANPITHDSALLSLVESTWISAIVPTSLDHFSTGDELDD
jgi:hypothetical protein